MAEQKNGGSVSKLLPVLFGFFIMGFCDIVGTATTYAKKSFTLNSETMANLLPSAVFLWFLIFSIPTGMLMNKIGRKKTVLLSFVVTIIALIIPLIKFDFTFVLIAFSLLGIGNTIIQVSLNPLLSNVVSGDRLTSSLTLGQFIKAICSMLGPYLLAFAANKLGGWQMMFPTYAILAALAAVWLMATPIPETKIEGKTSTFRECFALLGDKTILLLFLGILTVVGIDVGINVTAPKIMKERLAGITDEQANVATFVYFLCRTIGAFLGAFILAKFSSRKFYIISSVLAITGCIGLIFAPTQITIFICAGIIGLACANMFSIIFSYALQKLPAKANEISGLMIMGVSGGALFPYLMGLMTDAMKGLQLGAIIVILFCCLYQLLLSVTAKEKKA